MKIFQLLLNHLLLIAAILWLNGCSSQTGSSNTTGSADLDTGMKMIEIPTPAKVGSEEPNFSVTQDGTAYLSWIETSENEPTQLLFSRLNSGVWTSPKLIAQGDKWFANWADYPVLAAHPSGLLMAHFLQKSGPSYFAYDVKITVSDDHGDTWTTPRILHSDDTQTEHGFVSMLPLAQDRFFITWLDGRNTSTNDEMDHGAMTLRGAFIDQNGEVIEEVELDPMVCDCCQTGAAITSGGPVVVYRDRSEEDIRDISIVRYINGQWTKPKPIYGDNWKIAGCPVNGPKAAARDNQLAIAWFSASNNQPKVQVVFSKDGGASFGDPIRVDDGHPLGRVDVVLHQTGSAMISWIENQPENGPQINLVNVSADGRKEASIPLVSTNSSRASGFPQLELFKNQLLMAWTDIDSLSQVKTLRITL